MKFIKLISDLAISKISILAILITLMYFATYFDDGSQLEAQLSGMTSQLEIEAARRTEVNKIIKKEEEMRGNLLQLARNLEVVKSKIPNEFQDTQMSLILNNASLASGVNLLDLSTTISTQAPREINPNSVKPEDLIEEVKFTISLTGSYAAFLKFLDVLTKEDKVLKVRNFVIEKNSTDIDDDSIRFKGEVIGFKQASAVPITRPGVK